MQDDLLENDEPLLTRDQVHQVLVQQGFPIGRSSLDKVCSPTVNKGPPVAAWWPGRGGDRPLYRRHEVLAWARTLLKSTPSSWPSRLTQPEATRST
jgi:hypothetical protein